MNETNQPTLLPTETGQAITLGLIIAAGICCVLAFFSACAPWTTLTLHRGFEGASESFDISWTAMENDRRPRRPHRVALIVGVIGLFTFTAPPKRRVWCAWPFLAACIGLLWIGPNRFFVEFTGMMLHQHSLRGATIESIDPSLAFWTYSGLIGIAAGCCVASALFLHGFPWFRVHDGKIHIR